MAVRTKPSPLFVPPKNPICTKFYRTPPPPPLFFTKKPPNPFFFYQRNTHLHRPRPFSSQKKGPTCNIYPNPPPNLYQFLPENHPIRSVGFLLENGIFFGRVWVFLGKVWVFLVRFAVFCVKETGGRGLVRFRVCRNIFGWGFFWVRTGGFCGVWTPALHCGPELGIWTCTLGGLGP